MVDPAKGEEGERGNERKRETRRRLEKKEKEARLGLGHNSSSTGTPFSLPSSPFYTNKGWASFITLNYC